MTESERKKRNQQRMQELYPVFREKIKEIIEEMEEENLRPRIQSAWRSQEDQRKAFLEGHAEIEYGFHNVQGRDGKPEALAVDLLDDSAPLYPKRRYLLQLASIAEAHGLETGIRWGLPQKLREAIDKAIATRNWNAQIKLGWDPTHIQPRNIEVMDTKPPTCARPQ